MSTFPLPSCIMCCVLDVTTATLARIGSYSVGRVIGQGTYGTVRIGRDDATGAAGTAAEASPMWCYMQLLCSWRWCEERGYIAAC